MERLDSIPASRTPASKLRPPRVRHVELTRSDILGAPGVALAEILAICAPAGFGKSTLAIQWASAADRPAAWMTLDESDNDPVALMSTILAGLRHAGLEVRTPMDPVTSAEPTFSRHVLPAFMNTVGQLDSPVTMVLDEAQQVSDDQCKQVLKVMVDALPIGSQVAFVGRSLSGISLPLWRGQGRVVDIRAHDLQFDTALTRAALQQFTRAGVTDADVERVQSATRGWPVAVYLMSQSPGTVSKVTPTLIEEFIEAEVLSPMTEDLRAFVCETAALGEVDVDLAEYATGAARTPHMLGTEITTVLMQDTEDDWYRYHPLMTACAIDLLSRENPERLRVVRGRAAQWHLERDHLETAVQLALASGDPDIMGEVFWPASRLCLLQGRTNTVRDWLERAGQRTILLVPGLSITAAWTNIAVSDFGNLLHYADATLAAMPSRWRDDLTTSDVAPHLALLLAVTQYRLRGAREAAELAGQALDAMSSDDPTRALAALVTGLNLALIGDPTAEVAMLQAAALAKSVGVSSSEVEALALVGLLQMAHGRATDGCSSIEQAASVYAFHDLDRMLSTSGVMAIGRVALSVFRGRAEETEDAIAVLHAVRPGLEAAMPWYRPLAGGVLAFASARRGNMAAFREYITWCEDVEHDADSLCRQWAARARREYAATSPLQHLSPAELRVWELLKGRMTLSEIAERLFLSRETVKSHTVSIYRKLGVASRRQAQDLAESWT